MISIKKLAAKSLVISALTVGVSITSITAQIRLSNDVSKVSEKITGILKDVPHTDPCPPLEYLWMDYGNGHQVWAVQFPIGYGGCALKLEDRWLY